MCACMGVSDLHPGVVVSNFAIVLPTNASFKAFCNSLSFGSRSNVKNKVCQLRFPSCTHVFEWMQHPSSSWLDCCWSRIAASRHSRLVLSGASVQREMITTLVILFVIHDSRSTLRSRILTEGVLDKMSFLEIQKAESNTGNSHLTGSCFVF